jgi:type 1 glutamine amidotransferase
MDPAKIVLVASTDRRHNGLAHELAIRELFRTKTGWRIQAVRGNRFFTPEIIKDADLLVTACGPEPDIMDLTDAPGIKERVTPGGPLWTGKTVRAIVENIRRGMGFLALHQTAQCESEPVYDLLDIRPAATYGLQPLWVRNLHREHPITTGVGKFYIALEEQPAVVIRSPETVTLFETTAIHDKRQAIGGWCREEGKGRIVGLLPGHGPEAYEAPEYRTILWNAAYWALRENIPEYPEARNTLY